MDLPSRRHLHQFKSWISGRVQKVSKRLIKKSGDKKVIQIRKYTRPLVAICFLALAMIMGIWANSLSEAEAVARWEKTYRPSVEVVRFALGSRKMVPLKDSKHLLKVMRTLPMSIDEVGTFWMSGDSEWVVYYSDIEQASPPPVYCRHCTKIPQNWQPVGIGWRALESVIKSLDLQIHGKDLRFRSKLPKDPRALVY